MTLSGNRSWTDRAWGLVLALFVTIFALVCSSRVPPPGVFENLSIAAGVRPAMPTCDTLWLLVASPLLRFLPKGSGYVALWLLGPCTLGFLAYLFAGALQMLLPEFLRRQSAENRSRALIRRFVIIPVALLFCLSEPIWRNGLYFTPDTLDLLLAFVGFYGLLRFLRTRVKFFAMMSFVVFGMLSAVEPLGVAMLVAAVAVMTRDAVSIVTSNGPMVSTLSTLYAFLQRILTVMSIVVFIAVQLLAAWFFLSNGGQEASLAEPRRLLIDFFLAYLRRVPAIATAGGWIYFIGLGVVPLLISVIPIQKALDVERILRYPVALCYMATGLLAFLQLSVFRLFWLWQSDKGPDAVTSSVLLAVVMACSAIVVAMALSVLLVEVFFRHYERFAPALFFDAPDGFVETLDKKSGRRILKATWVAAAAVPYLLVVLSVCWRPNGVERGMCRAVGDYLRLVADDCNGSPVLITDGSADAGIELEMFCRGARGFKTLSMMGDRTPRESYLRRRGEQEGSEDWVALGISAAGALRDWVRMKSDRSTNLTVQIGFELWRREKLAMPAMGAVAGRTDGIPSERRAELVSRARSLGGRMLGLAKEGAPNVTSDAGLRRLWNFALWRLARAARMRSDEADRGGNAAEAQAETEFADALDDANVAYQEIRRRTEWVPRQLHARLTPREGLRFSLQQADFTLASTYARQILAKDEDDFQANFAMGMYYVTGEQYTRAMRHLERAHCSRPQEPSSLNNLATVEMHLGRLDQALAHAEEALRLAPQVGEIKRTVERVKHEIEKAVRDGEQGRIPR